LLVTALRLVVTAVVDSAATKVVDMVAVSAAVVDEDNRLATHVEASDT
jgi:hypothetical protein